MGTRENEQGVSFRDVGNHLIESAKHWGGHWSFTITADIPRSGSTRLCVLLERRDDVVYSKCTRHAKRVWAYWPNSDAATFAGLLFRLCYDLDAKLGEEEQLAQGELPF